jgi:hypothetical protein
MKDPSDRPPEILYPEWQSQVKDALLELDPQKLSQYIEAAETAIANRLQVIASEPGHQPERLAISDALATLRFLKKECPPPASA